MSFITSPDFWSVLASVSTVLGFAVLIWASFIAIRQLKEATRTRHLKAMLQVYQMIGSEEARTSRRFVYNLESEPENLTREQRDRVEQVTVSFDRIGFLVKSGLIPEDHFFESHCEVVIRSWRKLEPYIDYHIQKVGGRHAHHFRFLAQKVKNIMQCSIPMACVQLISGSSPKSYLANVVRLGGYCWRIQICGINAAKCEVLVLAGGRSCLKKKYRSILIAAVVAKC